MLPVIYARESLPTAGPSVFLAGPTPRSEDVESWRPAAIDALETEWADHGALTLLSPESRGGERAREYDDQVSWEQAALDAATSIVFWLPRDVRTLPGFTSNVEFGLWLASGKVILGCPPDCPNPERNRYLIWHAKRTGSPVTTTLNGTARAAIAAVKASKEAV